MEIKHFDLTDDEKKDRLAKALVSFILVGFVLSILMFFSFSMEEESLRWEGYIDYFSKVVNPAVQLTTMFLLMWFLALLEYHCYLKKAFSKRSSKRILLNKASDKMYDLLPRLFIAIGGCIFATCLLELIFLPYTNKVPVYIFYQMTICIVATLVGFVMLKPRRLMLNAMITEWQVFTRSLRKAFQNINIKSK